MAAAKYEARSWCSHLHGTTVFQQASIHPAVDSKSRKQRQAHSSKSSRIQLKASKQATTNVLEEVFGHLSLLDERATTSTGFVSLMGINLIHKRGFRCNMRDQHRRYCHGFVGEVSSSHIQAQVFTPSTIPARPRELHGNEKNVTVLA
ncbi:hypothetical protein VIGAN_11077400 [Vigna angularis var. angularis]|uniref:Uncharacterized protein n=1 Tax=Vigna angularis var. angularis TaxID=157739 RepID=A0A0S3T9B0_PHAAN|nr:hypothetical protein VIGAN_11077400 [Vigna angularis var. angularis]